MALWGGRFTQEADARFKSFNDSLVFDYRMAKEDIEGSIGWAKAIASVNAKYDKRIKLYHEGIRQWDTSVSVTMVVRGRK